MVEKANVGRKAVKDYPSRVILDSSLTAGNKHLYKSIGSR